MISREPNDCTAKKCPSNFVDIISRYRKRGWWKGMHILNNENKGIREATLWKTFRKGKENIRHEFSRAMAKGGSWK